MAETDKVYEVAGLTFTDLAEAKKAEREWEGIQHIKQQNDMGDPKIVLALHYKLSEKQLLTTKVGIVFLDELKKQLLEDTSVDNTKIYGYDPEEEKRREQEEWAEKMKRREEEERLNRASETVYKYRFYNSLIFNLILIIAIVVMLFITMNSKNVNILNYENRLVERYMTWEQSLNEREQSLNEREQSLNERE